MRLLFAVVLTFLVAFGLAHLFRRWRAGRKRLLKPPATGQDAQSGPQVLDGDVEALLKAGDKVGAIKAYRARHGVSLAEAHDAVIALQTRLNEEPPA